MHFCHYTNVHVCVYTFMRLHIYARICICPRTSIRKQTAVLRQARWICHWVLAECQRQGGSEKERLRRAVFDGLVRMDNAMRSCPRKMGGGQLAELQVAALIFQESYVALAKIAIDNLETEWRLIPKLHQLTHMVFQHAPQANPRTTHCYGDEDLVWGAAPFRATTCVNTSGQVYVTWRLPQKVKLCNISCSGWPLDNDCGQVPWHHRQTGRAPVRPSCVRVCQRAIGPPICFMFFSVSPFFCVALPFSVFFGSIAHSRLSFSHSLFLSIQTKEMLREIEREGKANAERKGER